MNRSARTIALPAIALMLPFAVQAQDVHATVPCASSAYSSQAATPLMTATATDGEGLFFSETRRTMIGASSGNTISLGLAYTGTIGVQGLQFTVTSPNRFVRFTKVMPGEGIKNGGGWYFDYQITNTLSGSELKVVAFGSDTTYNIPAGMHDDLFRITFDVADPASHNSNSGNSYAKGMIYLSDVQSALAHNLGYSAGVKPAAARDTMNVIIYSTAVRHELERDNSAIENTPGPLKVSNPAADNDKSGELSLRCTPNPVTETGFIRYNLSTPTVVSVTIRDAQGVEVARPVDEEHQDAGVKTLRFDPSALNAGMYLCTIRTGERVEMQKLVVVR